MTVNLARLRAFVAVADEGGFGAAAPVLRHREDVTCAFLGGR